MSDNITNVRQLSAKGRKHRTLGDYAHEQLLRIIIRGDFPQSRRLPSEASLADSIGVSRPVIRQALAMLRDDGVIASRQGSGSYVIRRPHYSALSVGSDGSLADVLRCYEFRIVLESAAAGLAAQRRTDSHLKAIDQAFAAITAAADAGTYDSAADHRFHMAVCSAAGNKYFESSLAAVHDCILGSIELSHRLLGVHRADGWQQRIVSEHRKIADAITDSDSTRAAECARRHIEHGRDAVLADTSTSQSEIVARMRADDH